MNARIQSYLAILMGVIIAIADLLWLQQSLYDPYWVALGVIIFVADIIWIVIDYNLMTMGSKKK